jgi:hypothetical protein
MNRLVKDELIPAAVIGVIVTIFLVISIFFQLRSFNRFNVKVAQLRSEIDTMFIPRISYCSIREFPGTMAIGLPSGEYMVAVSEDLYKKYKGWQVSIPKVSPKLFLVACKTNKRFEKTIDIYSYLPADKLKQLGILQDKVTFISPDGERMIGELE